MKKKKKQKYTQFKARGGSKCFKWSPLYSTGDGSIIIAERIYLILESIELHRIFSKSLTVLQYSNLASSEVTVLSSNLFSIRLRWIQLTSKGDIFKVTVRLDNADNFVSHG